MSFKLADEKYGKKPLMAPKEEIKADYDLTMEVFARQMRKIKGQDIVVAKSYDPNVIADRIIIDNGDGTFSFTDESSTFTTISPADEENLQAYDYQQNKYVEVMSMKANENGNPVYTGSLKDIKALLKKMEDKTFDYDAWEEKATLSLKDKDTSLTSAQLLSRQIKELRAKQDKLVVYVNSPEGEQAITEDMKNTKPSIEYDEDGNIVQKFKKIKGEIMLSDVRPQHPTGLIEQIYSSWDAFLKDYIYEPIGFAGYWDEHLGREGNRGIVW